MHLELRAWQPDDVDEWIRARRVQPPHIGDDGLRAMAAGQRVPVLFRTVAVVEGRPVGWVTMPKLPEDQAQPLSLLVAPQARGRGVGSRLWAAVPKARFPVIGVITDDEDDRSLAVAQHWGFRQVSHGVSSKAPLTGAKVPAAVPTGYRVVVADRLNDVDAVRDEAIDGVVRASATYPEAAHDGGPMGTEALRLMFPDLFWVLVQGPDGELVAATSACPDDGDRWLVVYTGVRPTHRRLGLARAIKLRLHAEVHSRGGRWIETTNEADNREIRGLNASLGYEVEDGELRLQWHRPG